MTSPLHCILRVSPTPISPDSPILHRLSSTNGLSGKQISKCLGPGSIPSFDNGFLSIFSSYFSNEHHAANAKSNGWRRRSRNLQSRLSVLHAKRTLHPQLHSLHPKSMLCFYRVCPFFCSQGRRGLKIGSLLRMSWEILLDILRLCTLTTGGSKLCDIYKTT